jgi:hypothetical protein
MLDNWKTTVIGAIAIIVTLGFVFGTVSEHIFIAVLGIVTGTGLALAADNSKAK